MPREVVRMVIRRVGVWSAAKLYAGIAGTMGVIIGLCFALSSLAGGIGGAAARSDSGSGLAAGGLFAAVGIGAIIIFPIVYGVMGLIGGAIGAALYNLFAGLFGGLE